MKSPKCQLRIVALSKITAAQTFSNVSVIGMKGTHVIKTLKGALLKDVLNKAVISAKAPDDTKHMYIVATAIDGYKALFSWNELFYSSNGLRIALARLQTLVWRVLFFA